MYQKEAAARRDVTAVLRNHGYSLDTYTLADSGDHRGLAVKASKNADGELVFREEQACRSDLVEIMVEHEYQMVSWSLTDKHSDTGWEIIVAVKAGKSLSATQATLPGTTRRPSVVDDGADPKEE